MSSQPARKRAKRIPPQIQPGKYIEVKTGRGTRTKNVGDKKAAPSAGPSCPRPVPEDIEMDDANAHFDHFEPDHRFIPTLDEIRATYGKVITLGASYDGALTHHSTEPKFFHAGFFAEETNIPGPDSRIRRFACLY
jgi:hypothetical protein